VAPFVTPVRAGSSFTEDVRVPLPIEEYLQYPPPDHQDRTGKTRDATYHAVYFTLGYYWRPEGTREETREVQGEPVVMPRTPPGVPLQFGRLESKSMPAELPVLEPVLRGEELQDEDLR